MSHISPSNFPCISSFSIFFLFLRIDYILTTKFSWLLRLALSRSLATPDFLPVYRAVDRCRWRTPNGQYTQYSICSNTGLTLDYLDISSRMRVAVSLPAIECSLIRLAMVVRHGLYQMATLEVIIHGASKSFSNLKFLVILFH